MKKFILERTTKHLLQQQLVYWMRRRECVVLQIFLCRQKYQSISSVTKWSTPVEVGFLKVSNR